MNYQFQSLLNEIFGDQMLYDYRAQFPSDWLKLMSDLKQKKRGTRALEKKQARIRLPLNLVSFVNDCRSAALRRYGSGEVRILNDEYLCLSARVMVKLFEPVLEEFF